MYDEYPDSVHVQKAARSILENTNRLNFSIYCFINLKAIVLYG
jgi:hypothetical protein